MNESTEIRPYRGRERRVRVMYVTRNTEYHFNGDRCVAVRERATGSWLLTHPALNRPLSGSVRFTRSREPHPSVEAPQVGEGLLFVSGGPDVVTSNLEAIARPEKALVRSYPV
jgi:hypothetical protein